MPDVLEAHPGPLSDRPATDPALATLGLIGIAALVAAVVKIQGWQFNVVNYTGVDGEGRPTLALPLGLLCTALALVVVLAARSVQELPRGRAASFLQSLSPLILTLPLALLNIPGLDNASGSASLRFLFTLPMIAGVGWAALRAGVTLGDVKEPSWANPAALGTLVILIVAATVIHTRIQINYFEHFMLGHADFGHFTEELKNALAGRGLRSDSFDNTRLGWHFVPLLYVLVPGYAIWPSPVYLMVCGALLVHVVALVIYFFARRFSGSTMVGFLLGLAWLLLPSTSRLVYSNTYGFQWIYFAMPLVAVMIGTGLAGWWRTCLVMVAIVLLCKETTAAATFGFGLYVALFTPRRKTGSLIALVSILYAILCITIIIPSFAADGSYQRLELYGQLGSSPLELLAAPFTNPGLFFGRFVRPEVLLFTLCLLAPMSLLPLINWRLILAAVPTLLLVALIEETDQINIKFWHQATVLPILFMAVVGLLKPSEPQPPSRSPGWSLALGFSPSQTGLNRGIAVAVLVCAALGHYLYGTSPLSKSFEVYASATFLHQPDPRLETVRTLRSEIPKNKSIHATERMAAHFTDYVRIYTGSADREADFLVIDQSDTWDQSGLTNRVAEFENDPAYRPYGVYGSVHVFERIAPQSPSRDR